MKGNIIEQEIGVIAAEIRFSEDCSATRRITVDQTNVMQLDTRLLADEEDARAVAARECHQPAAVNHGAVVQEFFARQDKRVRVGAAVETQHAAGRGCAWIQFGQGGIEGRFGATGGRARAYHRAIGAGGPQGHGHQHDRKRSRYCHRDVFFQGQSLCILARPLHRKIDARRRVRI